jgi:hypothetical protein
MISISPFFITIKLLYRGLLNSKGITFLFFTILILSSLMLLKNYQVFFENYYISYLKSIYPHNFSMTKRIKDIKIKNINYKDEIYEVALQDIKLYLHNGNNYTKSYIKSLGIRSFDKDNIVKIIKNIYEKDTIFISHNLFNKITSNDNFYTQISLNNPKYKFKIKSFKTHLENDYILMDNSIAKKLFSLSKFNIVNIYSIYDDKYIQNIFKNYNIKVISWKDRLPFFNKVFFGIYEEIFSIYIILFSILIIIFIIFFLSSLLDDMKEAIKKMLYFGNGFFQTFIIFFMILSLFSLFIFLVAYPIFYFSNYLLIHYLLSDFSISSIINFNIEIIWTLFFIFNFSLLWTLYYKINFKKDEI